MNNKEAVQLHLIIQDTTALIQSVVMNIRQQNYFDAMMVQNKVLNHISLISDQLLNHISWINREGEAVNNENLILNLEALYKAQQENDYILLADLYELTILPFLYDVQGLLISRFGGFLCDDEKYGRTMSMIQEPEFLNIEDPIDCIVSRGIIIEHIVTGYFTMAAASDGRKHYIHSNTDVLKEAALLAAYWYKEGTEDYVIYGLGLGFHIKALSDLCSYSRIKVYESNLGVFCAAAAFGILEELLKNNNIEIIFDKNLNKLNSNASSMPKEALLLVHSPSLYLVDNAAEREALEAYSVQYHSIKSQKKYLDSNFKKNIENYDAPADVLAGEFKDKDIYIVAAGPSLDKNIMQLKAVIEDSKLKAVSIIIAVGTVFQKLLKLNIMPDYIAASDAKPNTYVQLRGLEDQEVPLIGISTLYYEFFKNYKGRKYILFQNGYEPAVKEAEEKGFNLYETGGSVITAVLDAALRLGGRRVILLGADFAYTEGELHVSGTSRKHSIIHENVLYVKDICGNDIATGRNLNIYRKWIEKRIEGIPEGIVIDATEGGAYIKGAVVMKLKDAISSNTKM